MFPLYQNILERPENNEVKKTNLSESSISYLDKRNNANTNAKIRNRPAFINKIKLEPIS